MPDISILGSAVIREALFDAAGGAVGGDYRIVARWLLSPVTAQGAASGGVLPRVIPNPAGGYDCDRFILRLFTGKGPNRRDFNPATGQFEAGDFPIACAPQLDAIIRPEIG